VGLAVVDGDLAARRDVAHRIELDPALANAQHGVRLVVPRDIGHARSCRIGNWAVHTLQFDAWTAPTRR